MEQNHRGIFLSKRPYPWQLANVGNHLTHLGGHNNDGAFRHSHFEYVILTRFLRSFLDPSLAEMPRGLNRTIDQLDSISKQSHTYFPSQRLVMFVAGSPE